MAIIGLHRTTRPAAQRPVSSPRGKRAERERGGGAAAAVIEGMRARTARTDLQVSLFLQESFDLSSGAAKKLNHVSVELSFNISQFVLIIFALPVLARPPSIRELPGRMCRRAASCIERDFLDAFLQFCGLTFFIAQGSEGRAK